MTQLVVGKKSKKEEGRHSEIPPSAANQYDMARSPRVSKRALMMRAEAELAKEDAINGREHGNRLTFARCEPDPVAEICR